VAGEVKGELSAAVLRLHWRYRQPPTQLQLRIRWWGAPPGAAGDTVVPFHAERGAGAAFPLTCGPRYLVRYLADMRSLALAVEECPSGRVVGMVGVDVTRLDVSRPVEASLPLLGASQQVLATADVRLAMRYSQLLSSFEMAEHMAGSERTALPLYPLPVALAPGASGSSSGAKPAAGATQQQQAQAATGAAGGDTSTVVSGARTAAAAPGAGSSAKRRAGNQQQQHLHNQQQGQENQPPGQQQQGAAGSSSDGGLSGPLLEVIRKAEALKASLEQAAQAGLQLGLPSVARQQQQQQQQLSQQGALLALPWQQQQTHSPSRLLSQHPVLARLQSAAGQHGSHGSSSLLSPEELLAALASSTAAGGSAAAVRTSSSGAGHSPQLLLPGLPAGEQVAGTAVADTLWRALSSSGSSSSGGDSDGHGLDSGSGGSGDGGGSSRSLSLLSDLADLDELEDLLLQELLDARLPALVSNSSGGGAGKAAAGAGSAVVGDGAASQLHVQLLSLEGLAAGGAQHQRHYAVVKAAGHRQEADVSQLVQGQQQQEGVSLTIAAPDLTAQRSACIAVEVWAGAPAAARAASSSRLLGIAQVPLALTQRQQQQQQGAAAGASTSGGSQRLAAGTFPLHDVLAGRSAGSLQLAVSLVTPVPSTPRQAPAAAAAEPATGSKQPVAQLAAAAEVVAVRHVIDVTLGAGSGLPSAANVAAAAGTGVLPDARFLRYCFTGVCGVCLTYTAWVCMAGCYAGYVLVRVTAAAASTKLLRCRRHCCCCH
jgi:hypothetical protein